jgi:hypothetical protein
MDAKQQLRRCFIIGPMKDMERMYRLRDDIVRPLVEPSGFKVITPDEGDIGAVMHHVLLNLEQADLLIADLSGNNPNVMYELGIYHSFGKPYVVLKDSSFAVELDQTPFDIANYRYVTVNFGEPVLARDLLRERLERIIQQIDKRDWFGNPVTDFYQSPVAEIPTAVGLSKNYLKNFLALLLPDVFLRNETDDHFLLDIWVLPFDQPRGTPFRKLNDEEHERLKFEILVPLKMKMSDHGFIAGIKQKHGTFAYGQAKVQRRTREFTLHYRLTNEGDIVLADLPTVLSTLNESIRSRRRIHADLIENEDWNILEGQELERFAYKCQLFAEDIVDKYPLLQGRIEVVWRWNPLG